MGDIAASVAPPAENETNVIPEGILTRDRSAGSLKRVIAITKILVSGGLVVFLLNRHAPHLNDVRRIDPLPFVAALSIIIAQVALNTVRWRLLLEHCAGRTQSYQRQFAIYYASAFFSQILPSIGSDVVRALYHRKLGASLGQVALSILLDRGLAVAALLLLAAASLPVLARVDQSGVLVWSVAIVSGGALTVAGIGCLAVRVLGHSPIWSRLPATIRVLAENTAWALSSRLAVTRLIPLSITVHLMSIAALALVALSFHVPMSLAGALAVGPAYLVAQVIPISVSGWGVREAAAVVLFATVSIPAPSAMLVSIAFGVVILLAALPGAVAWLLLRD